MRQLTCEIIAIGTEILLGDIVNTNASHMARGLASIGVNTYHQQVVGDNPQRLKEALQEAYQHANVVITSGGLGPTEDDLSKETGAEFFGLPLEMNEKARAHIEAYMNRTRRTITENNWKQAMLPQGCIPLYNDNGTAPGFILDKDQRILIMLPGPPSEIVPMFDEQVIPYLKSFSGQVMVSRTLHICGIGESSVEDKLHDQMLAMKNPTLAPYAKEGIVDLRITAKAATEQEARTMIRPVEDQIRSMFGNYVFGADEDTLEGTVVNLLEKRGWKIATAESCTGGWVSGRIVSFPGASAVLEGALVTYSNEAKMEHLNVRKETLDAYGAVSEQTAREMAEGAAKAFHTETAVSTTGIAGPTGGSREKPVGTVCSGLYVNGKVSAKTVHFSRRRNSNRQLAAVQALNLLRLAILEEK